MILELKNGKSYSKTALNLALSGFLLSLIAMLFSSVFAYPAAACLAALICLDKSNKKILSIVLLSTIGLINIVFDVLVYTILSQYFTYTLAGFSAVIVGTFIALAFLKKRSKPEAVFVVCIVYALLLVADFYLLIASLNRTFSITEAISFTVNAFNDLRTSFVEKMMEVASQFPEMENAAFTKEGFEYLFDNVARNSTAMIFAASFLSAGISFKAFSFIAFTSCKDEEAIIKWRFTTTNVFAYFFCIVFVVSALSSGSLSAFSTVVTNLSMIMMLIYAYLGFNFAVALISVKSNRAAALLMLIAILLVASSLAVQILAFVGVFYTIVGNRIGNNGTLGSGSGDINSDSSFGGSNGSDEK